ncbi:acyl-CoA dehydrogenase family protein [Nocardioides zeae]|uniref:Acyl-CoA dehydrogenase n=1 Tax=Nocardioides zeae TaxID=1457234 RepID=A0AAJ1U509_9ACTN|nr:acyl-CoA dehydrogenase family protein [Nocardioides zeae]MDQ1105693.1 acyl-CoA dehydrogenase [Nocardioides zeae]
MIKDFERLSGDLAEIRAAVGQLCDKFPASYWQEMDAERRYPEAFVDALTEAGWLSILIPEEYGGGGMGISAASVVLETINRHGGSAYAAHAQMYTMGTVLRHGSDEQRQRYLPQIADGSLRLQSFGVTEADAGSDTTQIATFADRDGDDYVINGSKVFISRYFHSDLMLLLARTTKRADVENKADGISTFIVDLRTAGDAIKASPIKTMVNHETTALFIDNLRVPAANLIGEEGKGFSYILSGLNAERILTCSGQLGGAYWFLDRAAQYANERVVFDRPIGKNQGIQFPLAQAYVELSAASAMRWRAIDLFEAGEQPGFEANSAKYLSSKAQWAAANAAMDTFGGWGMTEEYGIERKFREARLSLVAPVSNNLVMNYVATKMLRLPRSY